MERTDQMVRRFYADTISSGDSVIRGSMDILLSRHFVTDEVVPTGYDRFARAMSHVLMLDVQVVDHLLQRCTTYREMFDLLLSEDDILCHVPPSFECMSACLHADHPVLTMCRADVIGATPQDQSIFRSFMNVFFSDKEQVGDELVAIVIYGFDDERLHAIAYREQVSHNITISAGQMAMLAPSWCVLPRSP